MLRCFVDRAYKPLPSNSSVAGWITTSLICAAAVGIIAVGYSRYSQAFDEPAHVLCGMEWLDQGTYTLEPLHPPLVRIAVALGPYLSGIRFPSVPLTRNPQGDWYDLFAGGNKILYTGGRNHERVLIYARIGELPFFVLGVFVVFAWTRDLFGELAALFAAFFFATTPSILAFAGVAYTDLPIAVFVSAALFAFTRWLERPSLRTSAILGISVGLAVLSKLTALLFLPVCFMAILVSRMRRHSRVDPTSVNPRRIRFAIVTICLIAFTIWGGYRFSVSRLDNIFAHPHEDIEKLLSIPEPLRRIALTMAVINPPVPALAFFEGIAADWRRNQRGNPSYLLGNIRRGGWWYFFIVALGVKTPLPILILAVAGIVLSVWRGLFLRNRRLLAPVASFVGIIIATMPVRIDLGSRHVLCAFPLLAILAAYGAKELAPVRIHQQRVGLVIVASFVFAQGLVIAGTHNDLFTYFNSLAGSDPEHVLSWGCDFDCGQDLAKLSQYLRNHGVSHVYLKLWTSADLTQSDFPSFDILPQYERRTGWIAVSTRMMRTGDVFPGGGPVNAYKWLADYKPVTSIGRTIKVFHISPPR